MRIYSRPTRRPEIVYRSACINAVTRTSFSLAPFVQVSPSSSIYLSRSFSLFLSVSLSLRSRHRRRIETETATAAAARSVLFFLSFRRRYPTCAASGNAVRLYTRCALLPPCSFRGCGGRARRRVPTNLRENIVAAIFHLKSQHTAARRVIGRIAAIGRIFSR